MNSLKLQEVLKLCVENNNFNVMTDENIMSLTHEEFGSVFGHESFLARMFEMESIFETIKYCDEIDMFTLVYFWYSTNLGLELEKEYANNLSVDLWTSVWQDLGQYIQCGWPALKQMLETTKSKTERAKSANMQGWPRPITKAEKFGILSVIDTRIESIREGLKRDNKEFIVK